MGLFHWCFPVHTWLPLTFCIIMYWWTGTRIALWGEPECMQKQHAWPRHSWMVKSWRYPTSAVGHNYQSRSAVQHKDRKDTAKEPKLASSIPTSAVSEDNRPSSVACLCSVLWGVHLALSLSSQSSTPSVAYLHVKFVVWWSTEETQDVRTHWCTRCT